MSGQADAFTSAGQTVSADNFGWTPKVITPKPGVTAGGAVATELAGGPGLATASRLGVGECPGPVTVRPSLGAGLTLEVPVDTQPGTYTGMLTVTLFPVD